MIQITTPVKFFLGLALFAALVFGSLLYLSKRNNAKINNDLSKKIYSEAEMQKLLATISVSNTGPDYEFYSNEFSPAFKEAYVNYRKGGTMFTYGFKQSEEKNYYINAAKSFAAIYSSKEGTSKEKAFALNLINLIYIGSGYSDQLIRDSVYTMSPFKEIYQKNLAEYTKDSPELTSVTDEAARVGNQNALEGAVAQKTMADINMLSYNLYPTGYALLRNRMNKMGWESRIISLKAQKNKTTFLEEFTQYNEIAGGEKVLLDFKNQLDTLEVNKKLFEGTGTHVQHEIYVMKTVVLWDPLISVTSDLGKQREYFSEMKDDFLKASKLALSIEGRPHVLVMINLYYVAFLVDYGITKNGFLDKKTRTLYAKEAISLVDSLIAGGYPSMSAYVRENEKRSHKPKSIPSNQEYYGGNPYYQLRVLAKYDAKLKEYLTINGWEF